MKIAFFEVKNWEKDYLKEKLDDKEVIFFETPLTKDNIDTAKDFDIIASFINKLKHGLQCIVFYGATNTTVHKFHNAIGILFNKPIINANISKFIHNHGNFLTMRSGENVIE